MNIKLRLTFLSFLEFFIWGAWLITVANYWFDNKHWGDVEFGKVFSTMGIAALFMPAISGIIADRWINAEKLLGVYHLVGAAILCYLPEVNDPNVFFWVILTYMIFYMPTLALANTVSYTALKNSNQDIIKSFPPIRVWGTIGFIAAMWLTNLSGSKDTANQFYIAAVASAILGVYSFSLPACPPNKLQENKSLIDALGLKAFKLFANYKMAIFFIFAMFLGAALQLTNAYGDVYLNSYKFNPNYYDSFVIKYSTIIMSISQISETLFILAIPFFLKRFGIKKVILISMAAWVLRFGLFAYGNPADGLWMIILSCIVYGMAFDFFNVSGSLYVDTQVDSKIRASAQGVFMMMTNGIGAIIGSLTSSYFIAKYFTLRFTNTEALTQYMEVGTDNQAYKNITAFNKVLPDGSFERVVEIKEWTNIWLTFALYAAVVAILFAFMFKHKHEPEKLGNVAHG